jgi:uncharacterized protein YyaL (SSP411 family)
MPNHLATETSPYLQQHAANPVDWYPWGKEALTLARKQNKPILLSIGYSACHWCHVMAHECFEDPEVAALMNQLFVNIKVDREERPDLDHIYQTAHQMLAQRGGGWPLTMFLTPDQVPFFGGTYFPKQPRYNLPGMMDLLPRVADFYHGQQDEIAKQNASLLNAFDHTLPAPSSGTDITAAPLAQALEDLHGLFDGVWGGFGRAPKFPRPADLEFLLRHGAVHGVDKAQEMALFTLRKMAQGGVYDQLGGGFCRYSVDDRWEIPHFEKMLYDNGPLLSLYADAHLLAPGEKHFRTVVEDTAAWVMREMQSPEGGYYSALDADSEHEEGKFYVWTPGEVRALLTPAEYAVAGPHYGFESPANFESRHWNPKIAVPLDDVAQRESLSPEEAARLLASANQKLFFARDQRVRPGRDEKILVSWNALMIKGMTHAARVFARPDWQDSARRALAFIRNRMWVDGRLVATYKDDKAHLNAYLDDYAFLLDAMLELLQGTFEADDLAFAQVLADALLERFEDPDQGGFFFTSHDHEHLIHRPKPAHDNATPSGNGVAVLALQRLGHLLGEARYLGAAEKALRLFGPALTQHPAGYTTLLMALDEFLQPPTIVVLRGPDAATGPWREALLGKLRPDTLVLSIAPGIPGLPDSLDKPVGEPVNAWVCQGVKCLPPLRNVQDLLECCKNGPLG